MAGVIQSSSQVDYPVVNSTKVFDVGDENQLLQLLNFIRRGPFSEDNKGKLRDAVLDFASSKNASSLDAVALALSVKGVSLTFSGAVIGASKDESIKQSNDSLGFGITRPNPVFNQSGKVSQSIDVKNEEAAKEDIKLDMPVVPAETSIPGAVDSKVLDKKQNVSAIPDLVQQSDKKDVVDNTKDEELPAVPPAPSAEIKTDSGVPLERIKEIKRLVNQKVGNPVNLIDSNNEIGREYMNALLNAMRIINTGSVEEVGLAMQRLESAYSAIEKSIESGETVINEIPAEASETVEEVPDDKKEDVIEPIASETETISVGEAETLSAIPNIETEETKISESSIDTIKTKIDSVSVEVEEEKAEDSKLPQQIEVPIPPIPSRETESDTPVSLADKIKEESVAREAAVEANLEESEINNSVVTDDPLMSNEVTAGLGQLLSEWKLFKRSGMLGIGPNGKDHPLYKELSLLTMASVVSGRFEGSTEENKHSIEDYMKGWRYEHNVVHEMNETFEHYLRRVIDEILSSKKKGATA